jgi:hypothetical protein
MSEAPKLAEVQWTWRRVFALVVVLTNAAMLILVIQRLSDATSLRTIALALVGSDVLAALLYMAGATTTDVMRLITHWKALPTLQPPKAEP